MKYKVIPLTPKSVVKKLCLCPTVCFGSNIDSVKNYYRDSFGIKTFLVYSLK